MKHPGAAPLALGSLAAASGATFLWSVGALPGMASRNIAAFLAGLALGAIAHRLAYLRHGAAALFAIGTLLLVAVFAFGITMDGVTRWLALGPLRIQPALIVAPLLLALVAGREGRHWRAAILVPIALVALQPDTATMLALAAGTAVLMADTSHHARRGWSRRRLGIALGALLVAVIGLVAAGVRTPPPVAFVEGTLGIAMLSGTAAMLLHTATLVLMAAALLVRSGPTGHALAAYFGATALAAVFWAFPMPLAGAGPSHLIGFGLASGWLASQRREPDSYF